MTSQLRCPHCGDPVLATDDRCMSCGGVLGPGGQRPGGAQPAPPAGPPATRPGKAPPPGPAPAPARAGKAAAPQQLAPPGKGGIAEPAGPAARREQAEPEAVVYAAVGARFLAFFVDVLIFGLIGVLLHLQLSRLHAPFVFYLWCFSGLAWFYFVVAPGSYGGSPGKLITGLRVVGPDGRMGLWTSLLRFAVWGGSLLLAGLPFIVVLIDPEKIGLHDRIAGTRVIVGRGGVLAEHASLAAELVVPVSIGAALGFVLMRPDILLPPPDRVGMLPLSAMDLRVAATLVPAVVAAMCAKPERETAGILQGAIPGAALTLFAVLMALLFYKTPPTDKAIWTNLLSGFALSAVAAWLLATFRGPEGAKETARILGGLLIVLTPLYIMMTQSEINGRLWVTLRSSPDRASVPGVKIRGLTPDEEREVFRTKTARDGFFKVGRLRPAQYVVYCEGQDYAEKVKAAPVMLGGGTVDFYFEPSDLPQGDPSAVQGEEFEGFPGR